MEEPRVPLYIQTLKHSTKDAQNVSESERLTPVSSSESLSTTPVDSFTNSISTSPYLKYRDEDSEFELPMDDFVLDFEDDSQQSNSTEPNNSKKWEAIRNFFSKILARASETTSLSETIAINAMDLYFVEQFSSIINEPKYYESLVQFFQTQQQQQANSTSTIPNNSQSTKKKTEKKASPSQTDENSLPTLFIPVETLLKFPMMQEIVKQMPDFDPLKIRKLLLMSSMVLYDAKQDSVLLEPNEKKRIAMVVENEAVRLIKECTETNSDQKPNLSIEHFKLKIPFLRKYSNEDIIHSLKAFGDLFQFNKSNELVDIPLPLKVRYFIVRFFGINNYQHNSSNVERIKMKKFITLEPLKTLLAHFESTEEKEQFVLRSLVRDIVEYDARAKELIRVPYSIQLMNHLEFYFGDQNFLHDEQYVWKLVNSNAQGFVSIKEVMNFNSIATLRRTREEIISSIEKSEVLELSKDKEMVRRRVPFFHPKKKFHTSSQQWNWLVEYWLHDYSMVLNKELIQMVYNATGHTIPFAKLICNFEKYVSQNRLIQEDSLWNMVTETEFKEACKNYASKNSNWVYSEHGMRRLEGTAPRGRKFISYASIHDPSILTDGEIISVMQYNILAQSLTHNMVSYASRHITMDWNYRCNTIFKEIDYYSPTFLCMQEVQLFLDDNGQENTHSEENHRIQIERKLKERNYGTAYLPKTSLEGIKSEGSMKTQIGNLIAWKNSHFECIHKLEVCLMKEMAHFLGSDATDFLYPHVAIFVLLKSLKTGKLVAIGNIHIKPGEFDDSTNYIQVMQVFVARIKLQTWLHSQSTLHNNGEMIPVIWCGDFNSTPTHDVYETMKQGRISFGKNLVKLKENKNVYNFIIKSEKEYKTTELKLQSTYQNVLGTELPHSHVTPKFQATIDFIWFSMLRGIHPIQVLDVPRESTPTPNSQFPSDHYCLLAAFEMQ